MNNALDYPSVTALLLLSAALTTSVQAAENGTDNDETVVDNVVVYGAAYRSTGTKSELEPLETPMSYEVYDQALLQQRQADSVNSFNFHAFHQQTYSCIKCRLS